jgi:hypothetical protein
MANRRDRFPFVARPDKYDATEMLIHGIPMIFCTLLFGVVVDPSGLSEAWKHLGAETLE